MCPPAGLEYHGAFFPVDRGWGKATQPVAGDKDANAIKFESTVNMTDVAKLLLVKLGEVSS